MIMTLELNRYHDIKVDIPSQCPYCHTPNKPEVLHHSGFEHNDRAFRIITIQCTYCFFPFSFLAEAIDGIFTPITRTLKKPLAAMPDVIDMSDISPLGADIYEQALRAEKDGYNQLVGIGLRKALEFCLKDFLCNIHTDKTESIKKMPLKQLIDTYTTDDTLKKLSTASVFLGNDETHYVRKHEDKDIQALKKYIELTFQMIRQKITALEVEKEFFQ